MARKGRKIKLTEPMVGEEELRIIQEVFKSGWLTEGPMTKEFEAGVAEFTGARFAIATTSCTTALEIALRALHIKRGDEVIVPDFTHPATADVIRWVGADPVLVDVDISSYNINMDEVEKAITKKTKCLIPVSWGGNPLNFKLLDKLKDEHSLYIVEDAACSLGSEFAGKKTGTMADITCFSFHPRKVITTGEGGMLTTDNEELAEEIKLLKKFGIRSKEKRDEFVKIGGNHKLCDILGAIGVEQMKKIKRIIDRRIKLANNYSELLRDIHLIRPPTKDKKAKHIYQSYAVYLETEGVRDKIIQDLRKEKIETQIGTYSLHLQKAFRDAKTIGNLTAAEKLYKNLLSLPMCHSITLREQDYVVQRIDRLAKKYS